jgi:uncharacterized protein
MRTDVVIKTFKTPLGNYVYDRETNTIIAVNTEDYNSLERISQSKDKEEDLFTLSKYQKKGLCKNSQLKHIEHPQDKVLEFHLKNRIEKITLQVTQNCNLRCSYCSYSGLYNQRPHANRVMSFDVMKKSIDFLMSRSTGIDRVNLGFYGGEPLLEISNIENLINYINENYPGKKMDYSLTTNGTIFTDKNIQFFIDNNFNIMISLDGPKELHNTNRVFSNGKGSFDKIMENLKYIKDKYPSFFKQISFNTVIAPDSDYKCINNFFDVNDIIEDNDLSRSTLSEYNIKDSIAYDDLYFLTYKNQQLKILLSAIGLYDKKKVSKLFVKDFQNILRFYDELGQMHMIPSTAHPGGPCIPGARRPLIDVDGNIYPCERVSEASNNMKIGDIYSGYDIEKIRELLNVGKVTENECLGCWNFIHCGMCAATADDTNELSREKKLSGCIRAKNSTLDTFKSICFLKENNFNFREDYTNA